MMADNANDKTKTIDDTKALATAITTDQVRAIVGEVLAKGGYVTAETVTALLEQQTNTFNAGLSSLRIEVLDSIKGLRKNVADDFREWRKVIAAQELCVRNAEEQTGKYALLAAEIKGQNTAIEKTLDRFSARLDDIGDDVKTEIKAILSEFSDVVKQSIAANSERIAALEKKEQWRSGIESRLQSIPNAIKGVAKNQMVQALVIRLVGGTAIGAILAEILRLMGGG